MTAGAPQTRPSSTRLAAGACRTISSVSITDLACGHRFERCGATFAAPSRPGRNWRSPTTILSLLARTPQSSPPGLHVTTMPVDLSRDLEAAARTVRPIS